jgi:hypothetical protein
MLMERHVFLFYSMMNRLRSELDDQLPRTVPECQSPVLNTDNQHDDDTFGTTSTINDHQAQMRRRAPTRHSIKSLTGRKTLSKQNSTNEVNLLKLFVSRLLSI